jgi:hypothetical protein
VKEAVKAKPDITADRRALALLIVGACTGVVLGCLSVAGWFGNDRLPGSVVASVNGTDIQMVEYQRALRLLGSEKREPINDSDRALVLERMIEEELLLQHGLISGLVRRNSSVREKVLKSILTALMAELEARDQPLPDASHTREVVRNTRSTEAQKPPKESYDTRLAEYLGQLEALSTIRRVEAQSRR